MTALTNIDLYDLVSPHQIRAYIEQSGQWEKQSHDKDWYKDCEWKHTATGTELHIDPHWNEHGMHTAYPYRVKENIELIAKLHGKTFDEVFDEILKNILETAPSAPVQETVQSQPRPQYFYRIEQLLVSYRTREEWWEPIDSSDHETKIRLLLQPNNEYSTAEAAKLAVDILVTHGDYARASLRVVRCEAVE